MIRTSLSLTLSGFPSFLVRTSLTAFSLEDFLFFKVLRSLYELLLTSDITFSFLTSLPVVSGSCHVLRLEFLRFSFIYCRLKTSEIVFLPKERFCGLVSIIYRRSILLKNAFALKCIFSLAASDEITYSVSLCYRDVHERVPCIRHT